MKFQLIGKIEYDEMNLNTASGDSISVSKRVLEEFESVDIGAAVEQAESAVEQVINRHCPETKSGQYEAKHFTGLNVELRCIEPVWKTSVKSGYRSWEPRVSADKDIQESHLLV